jgi:hypothetical protein
LITHIVLVKLTDQSSQCIESTHDLLSTLKEKVPSVRHLEVGKDITRSGRSYDIALIAKFDNAAGLQSYLTHPNHVPVSNKLRELAASVVVVDYESG